MPAFNGIDRDVYSLVCRQLVIGYMGENGSCWVCHLGLRQWYVVYRPDNMAIKNLKVSCMSCSPEFFASLMTLQGNSLPLSVIRSFPPCGSTISAFPLQGCRGRGTETMKNSHCSSNLWPRQTSYLPPIDLKESHVPTYVMDPERRELDMVKHWKFSPHCYILFSSEAIPIGGVHCEIIADH